MECPRCDGQGLIHKAKVVDLGLILYICDECEACWQEGDKISIRTFRDLSSLLDEKGVTYREAKIEKLSPE